MSALPPPPPPADAATMASMLEGAGTSRRPPVPEAGHRWRQGISKDELTAALSKLDGSGKKTDGADGEAKGLADKLMAKLDVNKDGSISEEELTTALSKLDASDKKTEATEAASKSQSFVDKLMAQLDADKDGKISKDELTEALRSRHGHGKGHKPCRPRRGPRRGHDRRDDGFRLDWHDAAGRCCQPADLKNGVHAYGRAPSDVLMSLLKSADTGVAA